MAHQDERVRQIAAVHTLIGVAVELGGRIVDGYGQLEPELIDGLIEELRSRIKECEIRLWSWDTDLDWFDSWVEASEDLAS